MRSQFVSGRIPDHRTVFPADHQGVQCIKEAGLDHIRFADLRHTCAVLSLQNGMDTKEVSQMLGHFRTSMTRQNYAPYLASHAAKSENSSGEASQEELRQAADILYNLLKF